MSMILLFCQNNLFMILLAIFTIAGIIAYTTLYRMHQALRADHARKSETIREQLEVLHALYEELLRKTKYGNTK